MGSLPSFTVQGVTFPLIKGASRPSNKKVEDIIYSYEPYYSGTGPNGSDPQTYAGSFGGLQPAWGNGWKYKIDMVIGILINRLYSAKNEWDVEREARFAVNEVMRMLTAKGQPLPSGATSTPRAPTPVTPVVVRSPRPLPPPPAPFVRNSIPKPPVIFVSNVKKNSVKSVKFTPKPTNIARRPSPKKPTPNKNPPIPPPPPPPPPSPPAFPPDKIMQRPCPMCIASLNPNNKSYCPECKPCPPGWYVGAKGECLKCPIGKQYITGSGCSPCPPGTTGESIHTGCTSVGPDGNSYTFIA
jgi:hypothetical protein